MSAACPSSNFRETRPRRCQSCRSRALLALGSLTGAAAILLALGGALEASADEAHVRLTDSLVPWVEAGDWSGLVVSIDRGDATTLATVSQAVRPVVAGSASPVASPTGHDHAGDLEVPDGFELPPGLARLAGGHLPPYEVLFEVVRFVSLSVRLDENDQGPQDARAILERGIGRCSGRANLGVGLLRALGLPARVVHGMLLDDLGARWHRWGEAWLDGAGWVPFDVGASVGLVSVRYLPSRGATAGVSLLGTRLERVDESGFLSLPRRGTLRVLPWQGVTLHCQAASNQVELMAVLLGPDGSRHARRGWGEVVFRGLLPGLYSLGWQMEDVVVRPVEVDLRGHNDVRLSLAGAPGG